MLVLRWRLHRGPGGLHALPLRMGVHPRLGDPPEVATLILVYFFAHIRRRRDGELGDRAPSRQQVTSGRRSPRDKLLLGARPTTPQITPLPHIPFHATHHLWDLRDGVLNPAGSPSEGGSGQPNRSRFPAQAIRHGRRRASRAGRGRRRRIATFVLEGSTSRLPPLRPGAHIDLTCPSGRVASTRC